MVVVTRSPAYRGLGSGRSRTMVYPSAQARVHAASSAAGSWADFSGPGFRSRYATGLGRFGYRGLGALDTVPQWVWWGAGGIALGAGAMFIASRMKRRRR